MQTSFFYFLIFFVFVYASDIYAYRDVCYYAKIRILKQITTAYAGDDIEALMFVTMQR